MILLRSVFWEVVSPLWIHYEDYHRTKRPRGAVLPVPRPLLSQLEVLPPVLVLEIKRPSPIQVIYQNKIVDRLLSTYRFDSTAVKTVIPLSIGFLLDIFKQTDKLDLSCNKKK